MPLDPAILQFAKAMQAAVNALVVAAGTEQTEEAPPEMEEEQPSMPIDSATARLLSLRTHEALPDISRRDELSGLRKIAGQQTARAMQTHQQEGIEAQEADMHAVASQERSLTRAASAQLRENRQVVAQRGALGQMQARADMRRVSQLEAQQEHLTPTQVAELTSILSRSNAEEAKQVQRVIALRDEAAKEPKVSATTLRARAMAQRQARRSDFSKDNALDDDVKATFDWDAKRLAAQNDN